MINVDFGGFGKEWPDLKALVKIRVERLHLIFKIEAFSGFFDSAPLALDKDSLQWRCAQNDSPLEISLLSKTILRLRGD